MKTSVIDTNVILRFLLEDNEEQFLFAKDIIKQIEEGKQVGLISILVVNELLWILEKYYLLKRNIFIPKLQKLFLLDQIKIIEIKKDVLADILVIMQKRKVDFTDVYLAKTQNVDHIISFDQDFKKF